MKALYIRGERDREHCNAVAVETAPLPQKIEKNPPGP